MFLISSRCEEAMQSGPWRLVEGRSPLTWSHLEWAFWCFLLALAGDSLTAFEIPISTVQI